MSPRRESNRIERAPPAFSPKHDKTVGFAPNIIINEFFITGSDLALPEQRSLRSNARREERRKTSKSSGENPPHHLPSSESRERLRPGENHETFGISSNSELDIVARAPTERDNNDTVSRRSRDDSQPRASSKSRRTWFSPVEVGISGKTTRIGRDHKVPKWRRPDKEDENLDENDENNPKEDDFDELEHDERGDCECNNRRLSPVDFDQYEEETGDYSHHSDASISPSSLPLYTITWAQLDQLVIALVNNPFVQRQVRKQYWEDPTYLRDDCTDAQLNPITISNIKGPDSEIISPLSEIGSLVSEFNWHKSGIEGLGSELDGTASMISGLSELTVTPESNPLYALRNTAFLLDPFVPQPRSDSKDDSERSEEDASDDDIDEEDADRRPPPRLENELRGMALCNSSISGSPIRFVSKPYKFGANTLKIGDCTFLNVPMVGGGNSRNSYPECVLRIEPPCLPRHPYCRVMLQVVSQVVHAKTGQNEDILAMEFDVSRNIEHAALDEFARLEGLNSRHEIETVGPDPPADNIKTGEEERERRGEDAQVDWTALDDEIARFETDDAIERAISAFERLGATTMVPQTLEMLENIIARLKEESADFCIIHARGFHKNGTPQHLSIPSLSHRLFHGWDKLCPRDDVDHYKRYLEMIDHFQEELSQVVARRAELKASFDTALIWEGAKKAVELTPLFADPNNPQGWPQKWVAVIKGDCPD